MSFIEYFNDCSIIGMIYEGTNGFSFCFVLQAVRWLQPTPFPRRGPPRVPGRRPTPTAPARIRKISTLATSAM